MIGLTKCNKIGNLRKDHQKMFKKQFNLNIWDYSSIPYCVVELVLDENRQPIDWIYRYCNQAFADIKGYRLSAMIDHSILSLSPLLNQNYLQMYYQSAYENKTCEIDLVIGGYYHATTMPVGEEGFSACMIYPVAQNKDNDKDEVQVDEKTILEKLLPEYVSLYHIELNSGKYEILRLDGNTNARQLVERNSYPLANFDEYTERYANVFILEEDRKEFCEWHRCKTMKKRLEEADKITYHYHSVSKEGKHSYYEAYAVRGQVDEEDFHIFLGYRNIDSILYKEKAVQEKLKRALDEARLSNEIISSIAKTYQYISRIDIEADWFEEISNKDKENLKFINEGILSVNNKKVCAQLVADEYQEAFFKFTDISTLPERMKEEETIVLEYRMKDGSWHKLRFIEKKRDENGKLTHVLCAIRSISATKKKEQDLLYQVAQAKKEATLKSKFLSDMSHDIRPPTHGIIGMLDLANRYPDDAKMQQKCRDKIMESSKYLVSLVNNILDINKLESEDTSILDLTFDLTELLSRANTSKQIQAADKNIEYVVDWNKSNLKHVHLVGNPIYLERLLTSIADNAIKFTNPGGSVHVWCVEKSLDKENVLYEFICSDNGIGMSEGFIGHAFDAFSQENETSRTKYEGSGLGLTIAKKLVERLEGKIEIKSKKGSGTTVIMTIPFKIGEVKKVNTIKKQEEVSLEGRRALVAEDNEINMEIVKMMLEDQGICVECASDGVEVLEKFEKSKFGYYDVILLDIMMPNLNGWDTTRKIRSMKRLDASTIPIIAMSANAFAEDIINSHISGMNEHLTKPLNEEKLLEVLKKSIGK